ncbi:helix-turn-helix domain-containing protein [Fodinibius salinus]|uniref:helix-turn-helix domain-containing protein n=1 Tax=Fodinibius salinus TaxID=860790 RepID=UPI0011E7B960|nr:AraC family transcriptional regulator [Fodinibius salinus]
MDFTNWFSSGRLDENDEFVKQFKDAVGKTPTDYINHHRIEASKQILSDPECKEIPIAEIANEIGYKDPEEFSTLFYIKVGITPEEYRKQQLSK